MDCDKLVRDEDLSIVASNMEDPGWRQISIEYLHISPIKVNQAWTKEIHDIYKAAFSMLRLWKNSTDNPTVTKLVNILDMAAKKGYVDKGAFCHLKGHQSTSPTIASVQPTSEPTDDLHRKAVTTPSESTSCTSDRVAAPVGAASPTRPVDVAVLSEEDLPTGFPSEPTDLEVVDCQSKNVTLAWAYDGPPCTFMFSCKQKGDSCDKQSTNLTGDKQSTGLNLGGLEPGHHYEFNLWRKQEKTGSDIIVTGIVTTSFITKPESPRELHVENKGSNIARASVILHWNKPSGNVDYYCLHMYNGNEAIEDHPDKEKYPFEPKPGFGYNITLKSVVKFGETIQESLAEQFTVPFSPSGLKVQKMSKNEAVILCQWPHNNVLNISSIQYVLEDDVNLTNERGIAKIGNGLLDSNEYKLLLTGLQPACYYKLKVWSALHEIWSFSFKETKFRTEPIPPTIEIGDIKKTKAMLSVKENGNVSKLQYEARLTVSSPGVIKFKIDGKGFAINQWFPINQSRSMVTKLTGAKRYKLAVRETRSSDSCDLRHNLCEQYFSTKNK